MFRSFHIGHVFGIPVRAHFTLVLLLPFMALNVATALGGISFIWGLLAVLGLFLSVAIHELGHSVVALQKGVRVLEILLLPIGGLAQLEHMPKNARDEMHIAVAGPITSLLLAILCRMLSATLAALSLTTAAHILLILSYMNFVLAFFNLLPSFPMDGGRIFRAWLTPRIGRLAATRLATRIGRGMAFLFGLWGMFTLNLILMAIALFIYFAAGAEWRMVVMQERMRRAADPFGYDRSGGIPPSAQDDHVLVSPPPYARTASETAQQVRSWRTKINDLFDRLFEEWSKR